jgi:hypothetical protein
VQVLVNEIHAAGVCTARATPKLLDQRPLMRVILDRG